MVKDAEAYFEEWIDYHLLGMEFDNVYIYDNSKSFDLKHWYQNTRNDSVYSRVQVIHEPQRSQQGPMTQCIKKFGQDKNGPQHDYIAHIDVDEFFVIPGYPKSYTNIKGVLQDYLVPYGGSLTVNWVLVGTANRSVYAPLPVTRRFHHRERTAHPIVKTIVKSSDFKRMRNPHSAHLKDGTFTHTTHRPGWKLNNTSPAKAVDPQKPSGILLLYHFRYTSIKEYLSKKCQRGQIAKKSWCTKDGKLRKNTPDHVQPHPGTVFDSKPWNFLTSKVPKYWVYEKFQDFH